MAQRRAARCGFRCSISKISFSLFVMFFTITMTINHLGLHTTCDECQCVISLHELVLACMIQSIRSSFRYLLITIVVLSNSDSTAYSGHTRPFSFPAPEIQPTFIKTPWAVCRKPGCSICAACPEVYTRQIDCFLLFRTRYKDLSRLWMISAWKNP